MFKISRTQLSILDLDSRGNFHCRLLCFFKEEMPALSSNLESQELLDWIAKGHAIAFERGFKSEGAVAQFLCISLATGFPFWDDPQVKSYLDAKDGDLERRLNCLIDSMTNPE